MAEQALLSAREKEVVELLLQGKSNKQIALVLAISERTVEFHLKNIYIKLGVRSRGEAILKLGKSTGVISSDELRESAVAHVDESAENGGMTDHRRIPMRKILTIIGGILLGAALLLVALVLVLGPAKGVTFQSIATVEVPRNPVSASLTMDSTSGQIQQAMLASADKWKSIWMDGISTSYAPEGVDQPPVNVHEQVWIDLATNRFRILTGPGEGTGDRYLACNGTTILEMDLKTGQSQSRPLPDLPQGPFVPNFTPGFAQPQPLWGQIGTGLSELAFTSDFAQNEGTFKPVAVEYVAGRKTLVVEWTYVQNSLPSWRAWLDAETAVILKRQNYDKGGGTTVQQELVVNQVAYDVAFADSLFGSPTTTPQFSDINGNPLTPAAPVPAPSTQVDPLGQVYFFIFDHNYGNEKTELVRLPGSCVTGQKACPKPEVIRTPVPLNFSLTPLVWSPDGKVAAYAYPISQDGNKAGLFLFDPLKLTWDSLAEFNFIDPPMWSPDGKWLAFRVQDGQGGEDIYAIRRDGTGLTNLTASGQLPSDARPYVANGWVTGSVILHSGRPGTSGKIYLMNPGDGTVKPLFETLLLKSQFFPSPDGRNMAYVESSGESPKLILKVIDTKGATTHELGIFQGGSIYPIVWSPDGARVAFERLADPMQADQEVFIVSHDGTGLSEVYRGTALGALAFSPDGQSLLVEDSTPAGHHVFVVDLTTLQQHLLQAPDLPLDWWWEAPSWGP
jgi:DNA-binding CsgD family transcriptional regulator